MPTYVITGSNRGLGLEWVRQLSSDAGNTVIAAVRALSPPPSDLTKLKESAKGTVHILQCDTGSVASIVEFAKAVTAALGSETAKVDYIINNAGINSVPEEKSLDLDAEHLAKHISVNVYGPAKIVTELLPHLDRGSVVVNLTSGLGSLAATRGNSQLPPVTKCTAYSISKAAVNMLSLHQASDLKDKGVVVIVVDPGWVKTVMGGEGAILEPEESVSGMRKVLDQLDETKSGKFYQYRGEEVPW